MKSHTHHVSLTIIIIKEGTLLLLQKKKTSREHHSHSNIKEYLDDLKNYQLSQAYQRAEVIKQPMNQ